MLEGIAGLVFADSGYDSDQAKQDLMAQDIALIANPTTSMEDLRWHFDKDWAKLYKQMQVVERVFSRLKNRYGLLANSCLSATSLIVAYNLLQPAS